MKTFSFPSAHDGPGQPLCEFAYLTDMPTTLRHTKRPIAEVKLLITAMKKIARYLDGLEDDSALVSSLEDIDAVALMHETKGQELYSIFD